MWFYDLLNKEVKSKLALELNYSRLHPSKSQVAAATKAQAAGQKHLF